MARNLELLAPAQNADIAIQAILHGADAVYLGASSHGARKSASNSLDDIAKVVDFAHQFHCKVYTTVNTIIYENELKKVENLCRDLYHIGVDALIVQDMGILRMNLPPIQLHASTQCDIRTPEKARFLEQVGFAQLVLARELTLGEIKEICSSVKVPVECFIHGALCVSYSGRCHASLALTGRSANRGECSQVCRYRYDLVNGEGKVLARDKYLLSLKDLNASGNIAELIKAGVGSFKIEGRLKDIGYVKNITAYYNNILNDLVLQNPKEYRRSSFGKISLKFRPDPYKSFNRGFTDYFQRERQPLNIASLITPKSMGEPIVDIADLNNGDGISYIDKDGNFSGLNINKVEKGKIHPAKNKTMPFNTRLYRTSDIKWNKLMNGETSKRKIRLDIRLTPEGIYGKDERGNHVFIEFDMMPEKALTPTDYRHVFEKLCNTIYELNTFESTISQDVFFPLSWLTKKRRELTERLDRENIENYIFAPGKEENKDAKYPSLKTDYRDNISNSLAERFYKDHGVIETEQAAELNGNIRQREQTLMTTRHCILREIGRCLKDCGKDNRDIVAPLYLNSNGCRLRLRFNCNLCEMRVVNP